MQNKINNVAAKLAQLAASAAQIVKGALAGGLYGGAIAAVKAFLPQLIKLVLGVLLFIACIPSIIFLCLPSSSFGYPSVANSDISSMTSKAKSAENMYANSKALIEKAVKQIEADTIMGYDDFTLNIDLNGIDSYWITAIASVLYGQDLDAINSNGISSVISNALFTSSREELYYEEIEVPVEDSQSQSSSNSNSDIEYEIVTVERKRIHLNIKVLQAEELMNVLSFSDFQKQWAKSIYDTIADYQYNFDDSGSVDLGDVVFTDSVLPLTYYNQRDTRWSDKLYAGSTIGVAGCGPTSVAMVVSTLTDKIVTPEEVAFWSEMNGHACNGNGSYHSIIPAALEHYGLKVKRAGISSGQEIVDALADGKLIVAIMGPGDFTNAGHFIVLRGVTSTGKVLVADSYTYEFCNREWDLGLIINQTNKSASAGGPFWVVSS